MKVLDEIEGLVSSKLDIIKSFFTMFKLEARLAKLSVFPLIFNICLLFIILFTLWLSIMISIGYFVLVNMNFIWGITAVLLINLGLLIGSLKYLSFNLNNMSFVKTREYFSTTESPNHDKLEKASNSSDSAHRSDAAVPAKQTDSA